MVVYTYRLLSGIVGRARRGRSPTRSSATLLPPVTAGSRGPGNRKRTISSAHTYFTCTFIMGLGLQPRVRGVAKSSCRRSDRLWLSPPLHSLNGIPALFGPRARLRWPASPTRYGANITAFFSSLLLAFFYNGCVRCVARPRVRVLQVVL
ncbi:hypothetical protein J6590_049231 [Homalodisca vitripennis]|nr:hypothetical protein J6590_049231 [Homalodisca vitripennis]